MKKTELKDLIKECYKEVIAEMEYPKAKPEFADEPVGPDNRILSSDEIVARRLEGAKLSLALKKILQDIHAEPNVIAAIDAIQKKW